MKILKKSIVFILAVCLSFSAMYTGCGKNGEASVTVSYYNDSEATAPFKTVKVKKGESVDTSDVAPDKTKNGYSFAGWTDEKNGTGEYLGGALDKDLNLYPIWQLIGDGITISFDTKGGESLTSIKGAVGESLTLPIPVRGEGWTFDGWYTDYDCNVKFTSEIYPSANAKLYAKWKVAENYFRVTFVLADGTLFGEASVASGSKVNAVAFNEPYYIFIGWNKENGDAYNFNSPVTTNLTLVADYYSEGLIVDDGEITYYEGEGKDVIIPRYYRGDNGSDDPVEITSIGAWAFSETNTAITSVRIPDSVTNIGNSAFADCAELVKVNIPANLETFGINVFGGCLKLGVKEFNGSENFPVENGIMLNKQKTEALLYVGAHTEEVTIPSTVNKITSGAFIFANADKVIIPATVTEIAGGAFINSLIKELVFNASMVAVANNMCEGSALLQKVTLASNVTKIGDNAFKDCVALNSIIIKAETITVGSEAFYGCSALETFDFDKAVSIGNGAFNLAGIKSYTIKSGVTEIAANAFSGWNKLEEVTIPATVSKIGNNAFFSCTSLDTINFENNSELKDIGDNAFYNTAIVSLDLSKCANLKNIGKEAFADCISLVSIIFPKNLDTIGEAALKGCERLEEITLPFAGAYSANGFKDYFMFSIVYPAYKANVDSEQQVQPGDSNFQAEMDNYVASAFNDYGKEIYSASKNPQKYVECFKTKCYDTNGTMLFGYIFGKTNYNGAVAVNQRTSIGDSYYTYYIPTSLNKITFNGSFVTSFAFNSLQAFSGTVVFTEDVTMMGDYVFYNTKQDITFDFSNANNLPRLGASAFSLNTALTKVELNNAIREIGKEAFYYCNSLTEVKLPNTNGEMLELGYRAFSNTPKLKTIYSVNKEEGVADLNKVTLNHSVFNAATGLTKIKMADDSVAKLMFFKGTSSSADGTPTGYLYCSPFSSESINEIEFDLSTLVIDFEYSIERSGKKYPAYFENGNVYELREEYYDRYYYSENMIPAYFFSGAKSLKTVNGGVASDGKAYDVIIPEGTELIAYHAFSGTAITSIYLPQSVKTVGVEALTDTQISEIDLSMVESLGALGRGNHDNTLGKSYRKVILNDDLEMLNTGLFAYCINLETVQVKDKAGVVHGAEGTATIPSGTTGMSSYVFKATAIKAVDFSRNTKLKHLDNQMFYHCTSLKSVTIPEHVESIGGLFFEGCTSLTEVKFAGNKVKYIKEQLFTECSSLKEVVLPEGLLVIGGKTFRDCTSLERVVLPSTLQFFAKSEGFTNCRNLKEIVLLGTTPCQIDSANGANPDVEPYDAFYNSVSRTSNFEYLKNNGLKIYVPRVSVGAYKAHKANFEQSTAANAIGSAQTKNTTALRPALGWNRFKDVIEGFDSGIFTDFNGITVSVRYFDAQNVYINDGSGFEKATVNGNVYTVNGNDYTISATDGFTVSKGANVLNSIGGTYIDNTYTTNNSHASALDKDTDREIQFRPQLTLNENGVAIMMIYRDTSVFNANDTNKYYTRYKLYIYIGSYTVNNDGTVTVTFNANEKYAFEPEMQTATTYIPLQLTWEENVNLTISKTGENYVTDAVTVESNGYTFTRRG